VQAYTGLKDIVKNSCASIAENRELQETCSTHIHFKSLALQDGLHSEGL